MAVVAVVAAVAAVAVVAVAVVAVAVVDHQTPSEAGQGRGRHKACCLTGCRGDNRSGSGGGAASYCLPSYLHAPPCR